MEELYIKVFWPEIQDYMMEPDYDDVVFFGGTKKEGEECFFLPKEWVEKVDRKNFSNLNFLKI